MKVRNLVGFTICIGFALCLPAATSRAETIVAQTQKFPSGSQSQTPLGAPQQLPAAPQLPAPQQIGPLSSQPAVGQPDMAVKVEKDNVDYNTRYEIKTVVENKGSLPTGALEVLAVLIVNVTHMSTPPTPTQCIGNPNLSGCVVVRHTVDSLAPGQKKRWKIGGKQLISTSVRAYAQVACPGPCADQNLDNNTATKTFGP